jgi:hypothetical protein
LQVNESLGFKTAERKFYVNVVYPYRKTFAAVDFGNRVEIELQDYEVLMLEVRSQERQFKGIEPGRWDIGESGQLVLYDESILDNNPTGKLSLECRRDYLHLTGTVVVPESSTGQIQVMFDPVGGKDVSKPYAQVNGKDMAYEFHERSGVVNQDWMIVHLPEGQHYVDVVITEPKKEAIQVGAWLVCTYNLPHDSLNHTISNKEELFPIFAGDEDRRVAELLKPTSLSIRR